MPTINEMRSKIEVTMQRLRERRRGYQLWFGTYAGQEVMRDLLQFSKFLEGPARPSNEETWRLIGRQDVIRRIQQHCHLTEEQLFQLYNGMSVPFIKAQLAKDADNG